MDLKDTKRLDDDTFEVGGYCIAVHDESKMTRLVFYSTTRQVLGYMVLESTEVYEMAQKLLKNYDMLEGIK